MIVTERTEDTSESSTESVADPASIVTGLMGKTSKLPTKSTSASVPSKAVTNEARVETIDASKDSPKELTETSLNVLDDVLTSSKETSQQTTASSVADEQRPDKDDLASLCRINQECYAIDII